MQTMENYLLQWDKHYKARLKEIKMFSFSQGQVLSQEQKQNFARAFYHVRGHFQDFVWYIGNHAIDKETKDIILKNVSEELNSSARSHEQLYLDFAKKVGVDVSDDLLEEKYYFPFAREFNNGQLRWLHEHDADERFAALSAYEKLDNVDYAYLLELVKIMGVDSKGQRFYKIHTLVEHFEPTVKKLEKVWNDSPHKVVKAFEFIGNHQMKMWHDLSNFVFT